MRSEFLPDDLIYKLLPATLSEISACVPKVSPDAVANRLVQMKTNGLVTERCLMFFKQEQEQEQEQDDEQVSDRSKRR